MKNNHRILKSFSLLVLLLVIGTTISCTTKRKVIDDDFAVDSADAGLSTEDLTIDSNQETANSTEAPASAGSDGFSEFDGEKTADTTPADTNTLAKSDSDSVSGLEQELNELSDAPAPPSEAPVPAPEIAASPEVVATPEGVATPEPPPVVAIDPPAPQIAEAPVAQSTPEMMPPAPEVSEPAPTISKITGIKYKGNSNGGTVIIDSDSPLNYTTRINSPANQVVVEVQNTVVANQFKRPLNTKDMSSSIGHVDVYQKNDSKTARFVIQLRPNSPEPLVQPEGNSLLIIGSAVEGSGPNPKTSTSFAKNAIDTNKIPESMSSEPVSSTTNNSDINSEMSAQGIMSSDDLEEFLTNNNKFYGKKISIETTDMDVRDILKFISEESGVNMIFDDDVNGKSSLKLRKVPWDQALVILLKSKKFGFRRQGSILRIAKIENLIKEDESAVKLKESKAVIEPLVVKNFSINYADIEKLETKIKDFIAENKKDTATRGRVTSDTRTNMLIVTETATKLDQISQLIKALDTQPQQVMIEARIIEASDKYSRSIGVQLGANRAAVSGPSTISAGGGNIANGRLATGDSLATYQSHGVNITPTVGQTGAFLGNMFFGTLGAFGNLDAQLALDEMEDRVKILSSPRIAVLTNTSATINQGVTILQPSTSSTPASGGATTQTFTPTKIGVSLKVTPQVSNIGTVRLQLDVSRTSLTAVGSSDIDDRNAKTEVIVKSGDTAVIGGVFQSDVLKSQNGVPGLKDIPILGTLFRGDKTVSQKVELMIFVTPKIIPLLNQVFKAENEANTQDGSQHQ